MSFQPQFGWHKDKFDPRDLLHKLIPTIPDEVDLSQYLTEVRQQGSVGSCVGHGIGINLNSVLKAQNAYVEWHSPTWLYNGARFIEDTLTQDVGASPRDALQWALLNGCLLEHFWPYNPDALDQTAPGSTRMAQATKYKDFAYYRVVDSVDGICNALADQHFVSIGAPWFSKWMEAPGGVLPEVTVNDQVAGGHETCLDGYSRTKAVFYGINSWGSSWGNNGLFTMPFSAIEVFKALGGYDAHYITLTAEPAPAPTPTPTPSPCKVGNAVAGALNKIQQIRGRKGRFFYMNP